MTATLARPLRRSKSLRAIDYLHRGAARRADAIAIAGPGEPLTYRELVTDVHALASALQSLDARAGSRVGICARNTTEHLVALLATYAAGKVWVPLNPRNGRAELDAMIGVARPTLFVADQSCLDRFTPTAAPIVIAKQTGPTELPAVARLIARHRGETPVPVAHDPDDEQIIKFSGGSTGAPKAVVQPARSLDAQARGLGDFFQLDASDANLIAAPLTHGSSCFVLPIFAAGGSHTLVEDPKPDAVLTAIRERAITTLYAPPTLIYSLIDALPEAEPLASSLRHLIYSAAPMSAERIRQAQRVFGPVVETAYGQVEAPQIITAMRASEMVGDNLASVGRPSPVARVAIVDEAGAPVSAMQLGEIVVQGPLVMSGYLDQPELTARTLVNGWLHTGDLGYLDERGYLYIRGRLREVINSGGFKVYPGDVEAALQRHPAVVEACAFGVSDAKWGEAVHAAVRLANPGSVSDAALVAFVKAELDSIKAPKRIHFVDSLSRTPAGKVSRAAVRAVLGLEAPITSRTSIAPSPPHRSTGRDS
ncbi:MAG: class I adenylate-forming enzyme family protein [Gemmatimonadales bacterium]